MAKFIKLHVENEGEVYLNTDLIKRFGENTPNKMFPNSAQYNSYVFFENWKYIVMETPEEILEKINEKK